jgi:hypothetical protein
VVDDVLVVGGGSDVEVVLVDVDVVVLVVDVVVGGSLLVVDVLDEVDVLDDVVVLVLLLLVVLLVVVDVLVDVLVELDEVVVLVLLELVDVDVELVVVVLDVLLDVVGTVVLVELVVVVGTVVVVDVVELVVLVEVVVTVVVVVVEVDTVDVVVGVHTQGAASVAAVHASPSGHDPRQAGKRPPQGSNVVVVDVDVTVVDVEVDDVVLDDEVVVVDVDGLELEPSEVDVEDVLDTVVVALVDVTVEVELDVDVVTVELVTVVLVVDVLLVEPTLDEVVVEVVIVVVLEVPARVVDVVEHAGGSHASAQLVKSAQPSSIGNGSSHLSASLGTHDSTPFRLVLRQRTKPGRPQREFASARRTSRWQAFGKRALPSSFASRRTTGLQQWRYLAGLAMPSQAHSRSTAARTSARTAGSEQDEGVPHLKPARAENAMPSTPMAISVNTARWRTRLIGAAGGRYRHSLPTSRRRSSPRAAIVHEAGRGCTCGSRWGAPVRLPAYTGALVRLPAVVGPRRRAAPTATGSSWSRSSASATTCHGGGRRLSNRRESDPLPSALLPCCDRTVPGACRSGSRHRPESDRGRRP